jgi:archaellum component FlaD/FlaE
VEGRRITRSAAKGVTATPPPPAKKERKSSSAKGRGRPKKGAQNAADESDSQNESKDVTMTENENQAKNDDTKKESQPVENNTHEEKEELANNNAEVSKVNLARKIDRIRINVVSCRTSRRRRTGRRKTALTLQPLVTTKRKKGARLLQQKMRLDQRRMWQNSQLSKLKIKNLFSFIFAQ